MLSGGCACGRVRYEITGPIYHETVCHCVDCRRAAGAPLVAWFTAVRADLRFTAEEPRLRRSSDRGKRGFCAVCGTPLTFMADELPDEIDIATVSLDDPNLAAPRDHTWTSQRLPWIVLADDLPQYPHYPKRRGEPASSP